MSVYRPSYIDKATGRRVTAKVWWYNFTFAGRRIQESSKSTRKTIAVEAEKKRRLELEKAFNEVEDRRVERIRTVAELAKEFFENYKLRNPRSQTFANYAIDHIIRLSGSIMLVDVSDATIKSYQSARLREKAAAKTINEEVGFFLRIIGERGDYLRAKLKRQSMLKLKANTVSVARAFTEEEKADMLAEAKRRRSPAIYPALALALNAGLRDAEIRGLQWSRVNLHKGIVTVGASKTEAGEGRTIPLNPEALAALVEHSKWFLKRFGTMKPSHYVFPFGKPQPSDPDRATTTFKTVWKSLKVSAGVTGRWHDNRHTFITDLAESGEASDETIRDLAGHVSKHMLKHYSHIRMEAKRRAVDSIGGKFKPTPPSKSQESVDAPVLN